MHTSGNCFECFVPGCALKLTFTFVPFDDARVVQAVHAIDSVCETPHLTADKTAG
jgi:hypothetical protein